MNRPTQVAPYLVDVLHDTDPATAAEITYRMSIAYDRPVVVQFRSAP